MPLENSTMVMGREAIARFVMATVLCWVHAGQNYTLEVLLVSYQNPTHMAVSLQAFRQGCCEASDITLPCSPCDNAFRVCGRENVTGLVEGECGLVKMESGLIEENNDDLLFDPESFNISGLTNPITVSGDMWPGTVELVFIVYDLDLVTTIQTSSDVVDNIIVHPEITASVPPSYSQPETFSGPFSHLELAFRLTCGRDHYGPDCIVCIDTNDTTGHYTCDNVTGDRVCLDGYQGPNCTDCTPLANCSTEGGYCEEPGDCLCRHGFTGEYCDVSPCEPDPCLNTGVCVLNASAEPFYDCLCIPDCENNKTCVQNSGCTCDMDYVEEQCKCELECGDHGHCLKDLEGSGGPEEMCVCDFGYTGEQCDERECTLECGDNGRCIEGEDGVEDDVCVCDSGFTGDLCETSSVSTGGIGGGVVTAIVMGILLFITLAVVTGAVVVLLTVIYIKRSKTKQLQRMQLDIMAVRAYHVPHESNKAVTSKNKDETSFLATSAATTHFFSSISNATSLTSCRARTRVSSKHFRKLGQSLVKYDDITLLYNIGEGEFGVVYKAKLGPLGPNRRVVAVKTLKGNFDQIEVDRFVEESLKMSRFKHSHIMNLIGVCLDTGSAPYIIMPYMDNGSLLNYLRRERENIVLSEEDYKDVVQEVQKRLMVMCSQIASGMKYLASEKYVHRDLAARNCMIDANVLIKITDFGLSEDVFVRNYFRQGSTGDVVKLPVKWMAPESLSDGHFSEKSDVWSYGVVMWEVFSGGKAPFPGTDPLTLMQWLETGQRMPKPYNAACTDEIYGLMRKCWEKLPCDRPSFKELYSNISKYIERTAGYLELGYNPFSVGRGASSEDKGKEMNREWDRDGEKEVVMEREGEEERDREKLFQVQDLVVQPSVQTDAEHSVFTNNTD